MLPTFSIKGLHQYDILLLILDLHMNEACRTSNKYSLANRRPGNKTRNAIG